ncbi:MAG: chemotaxis protein CheW [Humidesulfovibrio sp.]|jgi:purine-binding chemotaxis protein CheW|uniref:chemotaxis protein CheW n=1 Tax=Humidesulfovibrio sp. TaxID=2910988 RepID=UPI00273574BE|nr:chemotaxis protein CheW [Humidesulfovibrio sp.]MDP2847445.1 chemotaxis protein CheW [Humidesulfovibrio sp.]
MTTVAANISGDSLLQLVTFKVAEEEYGVDILSVQEIIRHTGITKVPSAPSFVEGILNLRGKVIPIIDMRKRFGLETKAPDGQTRIVVFALASGVVGCLVDSVSEVLRLPSSMVDAPPAVVSGVDSKYILGVGRLDDRLLILLDSAQVLTVEELDSLKGHAIRTQ